MKKLALLAIPLISSSAFSAAGDWRYSTAKDQLDDSEYSMAFSSYAEYQSYREFQIGFICAEGQPKFVIDAGAYIALKNREFSFVYRVDKNDAQSIKMRTYSNETNGGYSYVDAEKVAVDLLGGKSVFVRAITSSNDYLETKIKLNRSDANIKKVFADCGVTLDKDKGAKKSSADYSIKQFEADFNKLSFAKQQVILEKLQALMAQ